MPKRRRNSGSETPSFSRSPMISVSARASSGRGSSTYVTCRIRLTSAPAAAPAGGGGPPRPQPEPVAVAPVDQVVAALLPRSRPVGDLVLPVARLRHPLLRPLVHLRLGVAVRLGDAAVLDVVGELRALLHREGVERHVVRR